jgi:hypothetical protein
MSEAIDTKYGQPARKIGKLIEQVRRLPEGAELLDEIDRFCGYQTTIFNATNPRQNDFNQGRQAVANWLHEKHNKYITERTKDE